jgi:hypothetical protein
MPEPFAVVLDALHPSQLFLCETKLLAILEWFDLDDPEYEPLPVAEIDGELVLLDGHHRAFVARLAGADDVRVVRAARGSSRRSSPLARSADSLPLVRASEGADLAPYRTCVEWCEESGVESVGDLAGRVLDRASYEEKWIERCHDAFGEE